jgi:hypothetical protein
MGALKQKCTFEEEAALKARVVKHGMGKWRTILKDPKFNSYSLKCRSQGLVMLLVVVLVCLFIPFPYNNVLN